MLRVFPALIATASLLAASCAFEPPLPDVEGIEVNVTEETFTAEVLESSEPVLVDFGATWCGPCRQMEPVLANLSLNYEGRLKVAKVDVDDSPELAAKYGVDGIPAMVLIDNGQEVDRTVGSQSLSSLSKWVDGYLPPAPASEPAEPAAEAAGG